MAPGGDISGGGGGGGLEDRGLSHEVVRAEKDLPKPLMNYHLLEGRPRGSWGCRGNPPPLCFQRRR